MISGGGTWWTGTNYVAETSFSNADNLDLDINVTNLVKFFSASYYQGATYPTGIENEGFIIKKPIATECDASASFGELQYFSADTHTIYPPKLTFKWDDSSYSHSGTTLTSGDIFLALYNNKEEFKLSEIKKRKFRLGKDQEERPLITRHTLHAATLGFDHPITGEYMDFNIPLPKDMKAVVNQMRKVVGIVE